MERGLSGCWCSEIRPRLFRVHRPHSSFTKEPYSEFLNSGFGTFQQPLRESWAGWQRTPVPWKTYEEYLARVSTFRSSTLLAVAESWPSAMFPGKCWKAFPPNSGGVLPQKHKCSSLSSGPHTIIFKGDKQENKNKSEKQRCLVVHPRS